MKMSGTISRLDDALICAQSLSPADKLELISRLWKSIKTEGFRPSDADLAEIKRRSAELDAGVVKAIPWAAVRDSVRSRIARHE
jgi:putative addiction module component (TIGR02574 family)